MADHSELVSEIASVEKMATQDRLKHAKKRRSQQLKKWANYEKHLEKENSKKKKGGQAAKRPKKIKNKVRFFGSIMLLESAARNDLDDVKRLLSHGVSPDVTNEDGLTALHQCCIDDSEDMLKLLLEFGANVNSRDSEMWTPLHAAATCGHVHLCKALIDKGAELLAVNADGNMAYDICEDEVTLDYIETEMAKRGITQEQIDETRLIPEKKMLADLEEIAKKGKDLEYFDYTYATPLHIAAANGYLEVVNFLLDHHVSVDVRDGDSWQPIHAAACWLQPEILEVLVKNGADIDAKTRSGETAFDLCDDAEMKQKILDLKDEIENNKASRSKDSIRHHRVNTRSRSGSSSSMYSSNTSLNDKLTTSSSIRRTSMRGEKSSLFKKEAKEEALHLNWRHDDDFFDENKENLPTTNIDDVELIIDDEIEKTDKEKETKNNKEVSKNSTSRDSEKPKQLDQTRSSNRDTEKPTKQAEQTRSSVQKQNQQNMSNDAKVTNDKGKHQESSRRTESRPDRSDNAQTPERKTTEVTKQHSFRRRSEGPPSPPRENENQASPIQNKSQDVSPSSGQPRYPSGVPSITLSDLKRQRQESRSRENSLIDMQVQNIFLSSLNTGSNKYSTSPTQPSKQTNYANKNGQYNNNTQPFSHGEPRRVYKAPGNVPVVGDEDKQNCCVLM